MAYQSTADGDADDDADDDAGVRVDPERVGTVGRSTGPN